MISCFCLREALAPLVKLNEMCTLYCLERAKQQKVYKKIKNSPAASTTRKTPTKLEIKTEPDYKRLYN